MEGPWVEPSVVSASVCSHMIPRVSLCWGLSRYLATFTCPFSLISWDPELAQASFSRIPSICQTALNLGHPGLFCVLVVPSGTWSPGPPRGRLFTSLPRGAPGSTPHPASSSRNASLSLSPSPLSHFLPLSLPLSLHSLILVTFPL